jgi:phenylpyruvate tautomerase PptA (4-oxalocrotonate tautomerase family)
LRRIIWLRHPAVESPVPTYFVTTASGRLSAAERQHIASAISHIHSGVTQAPLFFAQTIFRDIPAGNHFIAGRPVSPEVVFMHGYIRSGRTAEQKRDLLIRLVDALGAATGIARGAVWAYLTELPPTQMVEYGHILPEPGSEDAWLAGLPAAERAHIERAGE